MHSNKGEIYKIEGRRMVLIDPELSLNLDALFDPQLLPAVPLWGQEVADGFFVAGNVAGSEFFVEKEGKPDGQCRLYYPSKAVKGEMYYARGKLHGPSTFYSEQGSVLSKAWFVDGLQEGKSSWWYPDGKINSIQRHRSGVYEGKQEYFYPDGKVKTVVAYERGCVIEVFFG